MLKKTKSGVVLISILLVSGAAFANDVSSEGDVHGEVVFSSADSPVHLKITSEGPFTAGHVPGWTNLAQLVIDAPGDEQAVIRYTPGKGEGTTGGADNEHVVYGRNPNNKLTVKVNCEDQACGWQHSVSGYFAPIKNGGWSGVMYKYDDNDVAADIYTVYMDVATAE